MLMLPSVQTNEWELSRVKQLSDDPVRHVHFIHLCILMKRSATPFQSSANEYNVFTCRRAGTDSLAITDID